MDRLGGAIPEQSYLDKPIPEVYNIRDDLIRITEERQREEKRIAKLRGF